MAFECEIKQKTVDDQIIDQLLHDNIPVIICGCGEIGNLVRDRLTARGVKDLHFCSLDDAPDVVREEKVDEIFSEYNVVAGYTKAYTIRNNFPNLKKKRNTYYLCELHGYANITDIITSDDYMKYATDYARVYETLADDKSKKSYKCFLQAKINEDASMLKDIVEIPQYFSGDFLQLSNHEVLVDCGAYIGDSIGDFIRAVRGQYQGIIAFEPDKANIEKLERFVSKKKLHDVEIVKKGAYDEIKQLRFTSSGILSSEDENGETVIQTDTIDHVVNGRKITYIKMDVEGSEMNALRGAFETIIKNHPVLGISAYHKVTDSFMIMDYLQRIGGYRFFFRCHKPLPIDAVLYAIPY